MPFCLQLFEGLKQRLTRRGAYLHQCFLNYFQRNRDTVWSEKNEYMHMELLTILDGSDRFCQGYVPGSQSLLEGTYYQTEVYPSRQICPALPNMATVLHYDVSNNSFNHLNWTLFAQ